MLLRTENKVNQPGRTFRLKPSSRISDLWGNKESKVFVQPPSVENLKANLSVQLIYAQHFLHWDVAVGHVFLVIYEEKGTCHSEV